MTVLEKPSSMGLLLDELEGIIGGQPAGGQRARGLVLLGQVRQHTVEVDVELGRETLSRRVAEAGKKEISKVGAQQIPLHVEMMYKPTGILRLLPPLQELAHFETANSAFQTVSYRSNNVAELPPKLQALFDQNQV